MSNYKHIEKGTRFGKLVTLGEREKRKSGIYEKCLCDCGTIKWITRNHLRRGASKSCGCGMIESSRKTIIKLNTKHGMYGTRIYKIFRGMYGRCNNPGYANYKIYGGRGIKILWNNFEEFYRDMRESYEAHVKEYGEKDTTIDRIDPNGNYCKENCRRATHKEQANNTRTTRIISYKGDVLPLTTMCEKYNVKYDVVINRLSKGWSIENAIEKPIDIRYSHIKNKKSE